MTDPEPRNSSPAINYDGAFPLRAGADHGSPVHFERAVETPDHSDRDTRRATTETAPVPVIDHPTPLHIEGLDR
ncbi:hypothetical protein AB0N05_15070 [Nocardia sp. NPDC051030]|uniref:hypothetical protein n=1 Tax=Nocardia sp. NPDC051030 TaxID=3155162 RepID=UPI00343F969D